MEGFDWNGVLNAGTQLLTNWGNAAIQSEYYQPYELQKARLQALGALGYYDEGQPGINTGTNVNTQAVVIPSGLLILAAVALVLVLAD